MYNSSGLAYYMHSDWLGSSRLTSSPSRTVLYDGAYAPFGESYAESPVNYTYHSFTGQNEDTVQGLDDFLFREYSASQQGRWISPDPAGLAAVNLADPQSWNRYADLMNNPLILTDALGFGPNDEHYDRLDAFGSGNCFAVPGCVTYYVNGQQVSQGTALQLLNSGAAVYQTATVSVMIDNTIPGANYSDNQTFSDSELFLASTTPDSWGTWGWNFTKAFVKDFSFKSARQPGQSVLECASSAEQTLLGNTGAKVLNNTAIVSAGSLYALAGTAQRFTAGLPISAEEALTCGTGEGLYHASFAEAAGAYGVGVGTDVGARFLTVGSQLGAKIVAPVAAVTTGLALGFIGACR